MTEVWSSEGARENAEGRARQATNNVMDETDGVRGATVSSDRVPSSSRHADDTVGEEVSALGERVKGAAKDAVGHVTGNTRMEREGEIENAHGRARQATNDVMDETDGVRGATGGQPLQERPLRDWPLHDAGVRHARLQQPDDRTRLQG